MPPLPQVTLPEKVHCLSLRFPHCLVGTAAPRGALLFDLRQLSTPQWQSPAAPALAPALTKSPLRSVRLLPAGLYDAGVGFVAGTYDGRVGVTFLPQAPPVS